MLFINTILILGLGLLNHLTTAETFGRCVTPKNENSMCIKLTECKPLYDIILKIFVSAEERTYLSKSQCGYKDRQVLVCCPPEVSENPIGFGTNFRPSQNPNLPRSPQCGTMLTDRIYGGNVTAIDEFPWMALLEYTKPDGRKGHHCGGSLINDRYVLTAAHCLLSVPAGWRLTGVRLGEWKTNTNPDCIWDSNGHSACAPRHIDLSIEKFIPHPQYRNIKDQYNDIALLRLAQKVTFNDFVKPICLPLEENLRSATLADREMEVAGWGSTEYSNASNIKLKAKLTAWEFERCKTQYHRRSFSLQSTQMCAGGVEGIDSCHGDSGGPLAVQEHVDRTLTYFVVGIVSYGPNPCGEDGWPGVYTRVADFIDFIENNVEA